MYKYLNGMKTQMTKEEEADFIRRQEESAECPAPPTTEERIAALEREIFELKGGTI